MCDPIENQNRENILKGSLLREGIMKKPHYAWVVCFAGMLLVMCCMGAVSNAFTAYLPYIQKQWGYTGTQGSAIMTIRSLFSLLSMTIVTVYYKKLGLRRGILLICAVNAAACAVYASAKSLPMYYVGGALSGMVYGIGAMIPASLLMNRWFVAKRSTALGICAAGTGVASISFPPVVTYIVEKWGLSTSFFVQALFMLLCGGVIFLLVRDDPAELGLTPYGAGEETASAFPTRGEALPGAMQAAMCGGVLLMGCLSISATAHYGVLFATSGYSAAQIAAGLSLMGLCLTIGKAAYGVVSDKLGALFTTMLAFGAMLAANLFCFFASAEHPWTLPAVMVLTGLGYPPATVGISVWAADFSKPKDYAAALKGYQMFYALGGLLFSVVPGIFYDAFGRYNGVYLLCAGFAAIIACVLAAAYHIHAKQMAKA